MNDPGNQRLNRWMWIGWYHQLDGLGRFCSFLFNVFISEKRWRSWCLGSWTGVSNAEIVFISCIDSYQNQTHQTLPDSQQPLVVEVKGTPSLSQSPCTPCPVGEATRSNRTYQRKRDNFLRFQCFFWRGVKGDDVIGIEGFKNLQSSIKPSSTSKLSL